jgi:hypothetical protein
MKLRVLVAGVFFYACAATVALADEGDNGTSTGVRATPASTPRAASPADRAQAGADALAAAERFSVEHPGVRFYRQGDLITRIYGPAFGLGADPRDTAEQFRLNYADVWGVKPEDLSPVSRLFDGRHTQPVMYEPETGGYKFTLVYYSQFRDGIPVFRADLRLLTRNEPGYPLVLASSALRDLGDFRVSPTLLNDLARPGFVPDRFTAARQAASAGWPALASFTPPQVVIWAGMEEMEVQPRTALSFIGHDGGPIGEATEKRLFVADIQTGEILYEESLIIFEDVVGNVSGMATEGMAAEQCAEEVSTPMAYARVNIDGTIAHADENGDFRIPNGGSSDVTVESRVWGEWFKVANYNGSDGYLFETVTPPGPADFLHNEDNTIEEKRAEVNGYIQANVVRDYVLVYNPEYPAMDETSFPVNVNRQDGYCPGNAWYSGTSINFCLSDGNYPNTAFSSVVHHEYGHHLVNVAGSGQDQYGEGMSDVMSVLIADDPQLALGFFGNCGLPLRNADNNMQYPCAGESHYCGNLLSGCVWSTRNELVATNPATYIDILSSLAINSILLHTGSLITPQITIDFLTLDDDDADIYNGTPHALEICAGFGDHNMDCPAITFNSVRFEYPGGRPVVVSADQPTVFNVDVLPTTAGPVPGTGELHYKLDHGSWQTVSMTELSPNQYEAELPPSACASWYVTAQADDATTSTDPYNAPTGTFTSVVGTVTTLLEHDFETNQGWTVGDAGDDATAGIWERTDPAGTAAQPEDDHTADPGTDCWVTDGQAGADPDTNDVDEGKTTLLSPTIDLNGVSGATIGYYRWFSNDTGSAPNGDVFVVDISNDNGGSWVRVETVGPYGQGTSGGWVYHDFEVADFVTPTSQIKLRFVASDEGSPSTIEAAIDDFKVTDVQHDPWDTTPPLPAPMTWEIPPTPLSDSELTMTATEAIDASPPLQHFFFYWFDGGPGGNSSGWQEPNTYVDDGLESNTVHTYSVNVRDSACPERNLGTYSDPGASATTHIETPTGLAAGTTTTDSIQVTATGTFTNLDVGQSGLYFEWEDAGTGTPVGNSGWVQVATITAVGLSTDTAYTFRVKARNQELVETPAVESVFSTLPDAAQCTLLGDANDDGIVNGPDAAAFVRIKLGYPLPTDNSACANYGGTLEEDTAQFIGYLLGG